MKYLEKIAFEIYETECFIGVIDFKVVKGTFNPNEESSDDYYGWSEIDWELLDMEGKKDLELELMLTHEDKTGIEDVIHEYMGGWDE